MSGRSKIESISLLRKGEVEAQNKETQKADMCADVFQAVHSSENLGVERGIRRTKLMSAHQWKMDRSSENDSK